MKLKGEDLSAGLIDWVKSEIKEAPKQAYDLGKFFFTVSIGTIGALAAIEKLNATSRMDLPMIASLLVLFASILIALDLARPRKVRLGGETDLLDEYTVLVEKVLFRVYLWFGVWVLGAILGGCAVYQ